MDEQLSSDTIASLRDLAAEIGRAQSLNDDEQAELYGHLEDKTLGYLSGEEGLSEADAVLLTREHFGLSSASPEAWRHADVPVRSGMFVRRLAAIAIYDLSLGSVLSSVTILAVFTAYKYGNLTPPGIQTAFDWRQVWWDLIPGAGVAIFTTCYILYSFLRRMHDPARQVWYVRWKPHTIAIGVALLLALRSQQHLDLLAPAQTQVLSRKGGLGLNMVGLTLILLPVLWAWIWVHWTAQTSRHVAGLFTGALVWYSLRIWSGPLPGAFFHLPLIATVSVVYVLVNRLVSEHRESKRGLPWTID